MSVAGERRRVLFVAEAVTLAHVARAYTLAQTLDPSRYEIHAAWDPRFNALLGDLPFTFHPIHSLSSEEFLRRLSRGAPMHDRATLERYVKEDLATIEQVSPDLVISDFRISLAASGRLAKLPVLTVGNAYWSPFGRQTFLFPEYEYPLSHLVGHRAAQGLFRLLRPIGFAAHTQPLNAVLSRYGLSKIGGDIRTMYTYGDYTAYADIPELVPIAGLPRHHRYVGAVVWSPSVARPLWWTDLPPDRPVIYVTPGSSGTEALLPIVLQGLADLAVTVIAATAGRIRIEKPPANARIAEFLDGREASARASVVICNGGSPTSYQALTAGVPVLGIVSNNMDQHLNMEAVKRAGAGEILRARGLEAAAVRGVVARMLDQPTYVAAARALATAHRACDPAERFPALVQEIIAR